eukprot:990600-Amphidinium_carterae.1
MEAEHRAAATCGFHPHPLASGALTLLLHGDTLLTYLRLVCSRSTNIQLLDPGASWTLSFHQGLHRVWTGEVVKANCHESPFVELHPWAKVVARVARATF